jgi:hypothetical protein
MRFRGGQVFPNTNTSWFPIVEDGVLKEFGFSLFLIVEDGVLKEFEMLSLSLSLKRVYCVKKLITLNEKNKSALSLSQACLFV